MAAGCRGEEGRGGRVARYGTEKKQKKRGGAGSGATGLVPTWREKVFESHSPGKFRLLCSQTSQVSNVEKRSEVEIPPSSRPSMRIQKSLKCLVIQLGQGWVWEWGWDWQG